MLGELPEPGSEVLLVQRRPALRCMRRQQTQELPRPEPVPSSSRDSSFVCARLPQLGWQRPVRGRGLRLQTAALPFMTTHSLPARVRVIEGNHLESRSPALAAERHRDEPPGQLFDTSTGPDSPQLAGSAPSSCWAAAPRELRLLLPPRLRIRLFDALPDLCLREALPLSNAPSRPLDHREEAGRAGEDQAFEVVLVLGGNQDGNRLAVPGDDDWSFLLGAVDVGAKLCLDIRK